MEGLLKFMRGPYGGREVLINDGAGETRHHKASMNGDAGATLREGEGCVTFCDPFYSEIINKNAIKINFSKKFGFKNFFSGHPS